MKTVIYARYSSGPNQTEQSIEGQLRECYDYATKHDLSVVDEYIDRKISGKTDNREQFQKLLKDSDKKLFQAVIVYKIDRFSRNRYDSAISKARLKKNGVKIFYAKESIPDGPEGIILETLLEGMAEFYSAELAQKIKRGMIESAYKCRAKGGPLPLGYCVGADKKFAIDEKTAPVVLKIFTLYDAGEKIVDICRVLNDMGIKTSRGGEFNKNSLRKLLKNEKYIGVYESCGIRTEGGVPAIIDKEMFDRVQQRVAVNRRAPARGKCEEVDFLLTGKLYCGKCGQAMLGISGTGKLGTKYYYYTCGNKRREKTCDKKDVRKEWLENLVVTETVKHILQPDKITNIARRCVEIHKKEIANNEELDFLQRQLADTKKGIKNLMNAIEQGIITKNTKARLSELEAAEEKIEYEIELSKIKQPELDERQIEYILNQFICQSDMSLEKYNGYIIDCFIDSVYLFDERLIITYNISDNNGGLEKSDIDFLSGNESSNGAGCECSPLAHSTSSNLTNPNP